MTRTEKLHLIVSTVKHMKPRQVVYRVKRDIKRTVLRDKIIPDINADNIESVERYNKTLIFDRETIDLYRRYYSYSLDDVEKTQDVVKNRFTFLNMPSVDMSEGIDWSADPFGYELWRFNLHYFDYLIDIGKLAIIEQNDDCLIRGKELIIDWIDKNKAYDKCAWSPYVISKRIINWLWFVNLLYYTNALDNDFVIKIYNSIKIQAEVIYRNIEYDLGANHLIMDGKGLTFAGIALNNKRYLYRGLKLMDNELKEQVLHDGGHYERSVSYHVEVLMHYLETALLLMKNHDGDTGNEIIRLIKPMFDYLYELMKPDGNIPLLNDSSENYPIYARDVLSCGVVLYKEPRYKKYCDENLSEYGLWLLGTKGFNDYKNITVSRDAGHNVLLDKSGYYIIKDELNDKQELYLLFDAGANGPSYNLGHAHADSLNIILSIGKDDILIDSGTFTYKPGKKRNYFRSTAAHNTVMIDGISSSEIWSAFRVGERADAKLRRYVDNDRMTIIVGEHDGYTKLLNKGEKIVHQRAVIYLKKQWFLIVDYLYGHTQYEHDFTLNYILSSNISINNFNTNGFSCKYSDREIRMLFDSPYELKDVYISREFGVKQLTKKIVVEKKGKTPQFFVSYAGIDPVSVGTELKSRPHIAGDKSGLKVNVTGAFEIEYISSKTGGWINIDGKKIEW